MTGVHIGWIEAGVIEGHGASGPFPSATGYMPCSDRDDRRSHPSGVVREGMKHSTIKVMQAAVDRRFCFCLIGSDRSGM